MANNFELEVKDKLLWTLEQWRKGGECIKSIKRLVNSVKYWFGRLRNALRATNVVMTLYGKHNRDKRAYPKLQQIVESIGLLDKDIKIVGYAKLKNKRFISVSFVDKETRDFVANNLKKIGENEIAFLHWVNDIQQTKIVIDWLSNDTEFDLVVDYVDKFMLINSAQKEITTLEDGSTYVSGKVICRGELRNGIMIDQIPHFDYIDGLECLIITEGRPYRCFNCLREGHRAFQCIKAFCGDCYKMVNKMHLCKQLENNIDGSMHNWRESNIPLNVQASGQELQSEINNQCAEKSTDSAKNLFWDESKSILSENGKNDTARKLAQWPMDFEIQLKSEQPLDLKYDSRGSIMWKTSVDIPSSEILTHNEYVSEACNSDSPNFILEDTTSEESTSDDQTNEDFLLKADWCIKDMTACAEMSRSLLQNSFELVKSVAVDKSQDLAMNHDLDINKQVIQENIPSLSVKGARSKILDLNVKKSMGQYKDKQKKQGGRKKKK